MGRPEPSEYAAYFGKYVALVPENDIVSAMEKELEQTLTLLRSIPEKEALVRHAPYTWSIKEVLGHVTDTERIFGLREQVSHDSARWSVLFRAGNCPWVDCRRIGKQCG
jgi:hypothetical protein